MRSAEIQIRGIITPIITPMNPDESVCVEELRNQVRRQIKAGVQGIFCFGTNGEGYILERWEKEKILESVVEETAGRIPVYAGTGCISTKETIDFSKRAQELGADVLSVITPYFAAATQEELAEHYIAVADAAEIPVILYNIPARTGHNLAPDTVRQLAEHPNIVGVKDSSGNFDQMLQYIEAGKGQKFCVLSGNDSLILWNLLAGGTGGIAGCANVFPERMTAIYEAFSAGELARARELQESVRVFRDCFKYGNPNTVVKAAVEMLGFPVGKCRKPFAGVSEETEKKIREALEKLGSITGG